jgi:hypothetical protein
MRQQPNDLLDQRDALLDRLSKLGTVTVAELGDGGIRVLFGGTGVPLVDDHRTDNPLTPGDDRVAWPQTLTAPGGKLGALIDLSRTPGGIIDQYRNDLGAGRAGARDDDQRAAPPDREPARLLRVRPAPARRRPERHAHHRPDRRQPDRHRGGNDLATEIGALRGKATDNMYAAFVARVGSDVNQNLRAQANAEVLATRSRTAASRPRASRSTRR